MSHPYNYYRCQNDRQPNHERQQQNRFAQTTMQSNCGPMGSHASHPPPPSPYFRPSPPYYSARQTSRGQYRAQVIDYSNRSLNNEIPANKYSADFGAASVNQPPFNTSFRGGFEPRPPPPYNNIGGPAPPFLPPSNYGAVPPLPPVQNYHQPEAHLNYNSMHPPLQNYPQPPPPLPPPPPPQHNYPPFPNQQNYPPLPPPPPPAEQTKSGFNSNDGLGSSHMRPSQHAAKAVPPPDPLTSIHQGESFFSTFQPQSNSFSGTANQQNTDLLPKPHSATQNQSNIVNNVQNGNKTMLGSQCHSGAANSTQNTLRPALKANAKGPENRLTPNNSDPNKKTEGKKAEFDKLKFEGMVVKVEKGVSGYYCVFCETFAADLVTAKMHVESPKHQRTKVGDFLKGIDAKFTIKSDRINEIQVALARKQELIKIDNIIKTDYFNHGIRLKDGIGPNAYICQKCETSLENLTQVKDHIEKHKVFEEQLKLCTKPIIGLDFVIEYIDPDPSKLRVYDCTLCKRIFSSLEILSHVCSFLHRTNFIKRVHPSEGKKYCTETQESTLEAEKRALELETLIGRGLFKVKNEPAPKGRYPDSPGVSLMPHTTNHMEISAAPAVPPAKVSFQLSNAKINVELPKPKLDCEKSELEKLLSVELKSEEDVNQVTKVITSLTDSVLDYHLSKFTPEMREKLKQQIKSN